MPKIGDLITWKAADVWQQIGTVVNILSINDKQYAKVLAITTEDYPVSTDDFYECIIDFSSAKFMPRIINNLCDVPE